MNTDADDFQHCDSLSGTELGARAVSMPPSLRPPPVQPRRFSRARSLFGAAALITAGAAVALYLQRGSVTPPEALDALRVEGNTLSFSEKFAVRAGIHTIEVAQMPFSPVVSLVGKTTYDPNHVVAIGASALGTVRRVAKYEGETVQVGDVLAEIGSPMLARVEAASLLRSRSAPHGTLGVSTLRSPLAGTVVERRIVTGQSVRGERVAFVVANLDHLWLDVHVDEAQARTLHIGDRVELGRESEPAAQIEGHVAALDAQNNQENKPMLVRIEVDNHARYLRLGQTVTARVLARRMRSRVMLVPNRALATIGGEPAVFVSTGHNSVNASPITLGSSNGVDTEVVNGLVPGQRVVSDGVRVLKEESFL